MNRTILITAFEPFGGQSINASQEVLKILPDKIAGYDVHKAVLPVVFGEAGRAVLGMTEKIKPAFVFMLGEAGGREFVTSETTARGDEDTLSTHVPVAQIVEEMKEFPISVSDDAGSYVCNDTFYIVLEGLKGSDVTADFIHVPYCPGQEKLRMSDASGNEMANPVAVMETEKAAETVKRFIELAAERFI